MTTGSSTMTNRYGITEAKKAELDALAQDVLNAQATVVQLQSVVNSLTEKSTMFKTDLSVSTDNLNVTTQNKGDLANIVNLANNLKNNSEVAFEEVGRADAKTKLLAIQVRDVMLELIYSAEVIDKLQNLIIRKKALNPLISDELVTLITKAGTDANNAVALSLVALNSTFTAQASIIEARSATGLEFGEATTLYNSLSAPPKEPVLLGDSLPVVQDLPKISVLIKAAYDNAVINNDAAQDAVDKSTTQLNKANAELKQASIKLQSLEAGLAAANAAALAS